LGTPSQKDYYTSVYVTVETRSTWEELISFMAELQAPEKFIVVESANLKKYPADETKMQGALRIAKWYAPN
ncbi:MAG: hypothetical protein EOP84_08610, partial [Verrucomicrobiaceae bacterium]